MGNQSSNVIAVVAIFAMLSVLGMAASVGEDEIADTPGLVGQLQAIRSELRGIADRLGSVEEQQRLVALVGRIQLKQQRLSTIEGQLRSARGEQEANEQEIERLDAVLDSWPKTKEGRVVDDERGGEERRQLELMQQSRKSLGARVETLRLRIVELDNELARGQRDLLALEETVDERLGLR